jgi:hypothetical protein
MAHCQNCHTPLDGSFCPNCGQRDVDLERPTRQLVAELLKETFDVDGRAFRSVKALLLHPGALTSEFLAGRRRLYTSPIRLYLVISVSFFVLAAWLASQGILLDPGQHPQHDAATQARFMSDELPRLMFALLPLFALLLKILFSNRLYFDHIIFSIHLHSAAYITLAFMLPLEEIAEDHWLPLIAQIALLVYFLSYLVISIHRVYRASWIIASAKSTAVLLVYLTAFSGAIEALSSLQILSD